MARKRVSLVYSIRSESLSLYPVFNFGFTENPNSFILLPPISSLRVSYYFLKQKEALKKFSAYYFFSAI